MDLLSIQVVTHGSAQYHSAVELRLKILRTPLGLNFTSEELAREQADIHICAFNVDKVIACLFLSPQPALQGRGQLLMRQVAVDTPFQGLGIGKKLVHFSEKWAQENNFKELELKARETAVPFYLSMGYKVVGSPFVQVGLPHYLMRKKLA